MPYNKQLNNLDRSVVTGKSQTSAYRIDLANARSIQQGLSWRFSRNDSLLVNGCSLSNEEQRMGNEEWGAGTGSGNGERERESGNECTAVTRLMIQNGGERERQLSDGIWENSVVTFYKRTSKY